MLGGLAVRADGGVDLLGLSRAHGVGAVTEPGLRDDVDLDRLAVDGRALVAGVVDGLVGVGDKGGVHFAQYGRQVGSGLAGGRGRDAGDGDRGGRLPPLLVTAYHTARCLHAEAGLPLAVDPALPRPDNEHALPADSTVLLHTDGLVEHPADTLEVGMRHAAHVAALHATEPLPHLCDALLAHRRGRTFHDDVALLATCVTRLPSCQWGRLARHRPALRPATLERRDVWTTAVPLDEVRVDHVQLVPAHQPGLSQASAWQCSLLHQAAAALRSSARAPHSAAGEGWTAA
ncbi:SpoIIE family protein phosphatase [Streptomyces sp. NPDC005706]|uniref:SpoIIE family protein phosphatase n=1 Tax=Streptomyces sp. NPDC005706 TaxID=3157169 RepID=UPI0033FD6C87